MSNTKPELTIATVCGTALCHDGKPHNYDRWVILRDSDGRETGASAACSLCNSTAIARDLLRLP